MSIFIQNPYITTDVSNNIHTHQYLSIVNKIAILNDNTSINSIKLKELASCDTQLTLSSQSCFSDSDISDSSRIPTFGDGSIAMTSV